ncbi:MAG TPA: DUF4149 domain-containing protein [Gammaproteobacteria bacterium]|nr:DUF4149 domain-containing protein [Gammaproteobacteria bacterium]
MLAGERILLTLWVGGLWAIGYIVAPTLFVNLDDRALAGTLAGQMFAIIAWIGLVCGAILLILNQLRHPRRRSNWRALVLLAMLLLVLAGQFILAPMIADLRAAGATATAAFARLHGMASVAYLVTSLLGLALVAAPCEESRGQG